MLILKTIQEVGINFIGHSLKIIYALSLEYLHVYMCCLIFETKLLLKILVLSDAQDT